MTLRDLAVQAYTLMLLGLGYGSHCLIANRDVSRYVQPKLVSGNIVRH